VPPHPLSLWTAGCEDDIMYATFDLLIVFCYGYSVWHRAIQYIIEAKLLG